MMPWSGLLPNHIGHANEMGTSDLPHDGGLRGLSRTEACTHVILDEGGRDSRATIRPKLKPSLREQQRLRGTA